MDQTFEANKIVINLTRFNNNFEMVIDHIGHLDQTFPFEK
jgi:hypothetical protein